MATSVSATTPSRTPIVSESVPSPMENEGRLPARRKTSIITHLAVLTAIVLPIALVPYLAMRRHLTVLRKQIEEIRATTVAIQREAKSVWSETARLKGEDRSDKALLHSMSLKQEVDGLRIAMEERHKTQMSHLQKLRNETMQPRMLGSLRKPVVDLAAKIKAKISAGGAKNNLIKNFGAQKAEILPAKQGDKKKRENEK